MRGLLLSLLISLLMLHPRVLRADDEGAETDENRPRMRTPFLQERIQERLRERFAQGQGFESFQQDDTLRGAELRAREQLRIVEQFLDMPPEQLARVRRTLERLEQMEPEQREALRRHVKRMREMSDGSVVFLRFIAPNVDPNDREVLRERWIQMTAEERLALSRRLFDMEPGERRSFLSRQAMRLRAADNEAADTEPAESEPTEDSRSEDLDAEE